DRFGQPFRAAKSVGDSGGGARIFLVSGVSDQSPTRAVRTAHMVRNYAADEMRFAAPGAHALSQLGDVFGDGSGVVAFHIRANLIEFACGKGSADQGEVVVRVIGKHNAAGTQPQVPALHGHAAPIGVP